MLSEIPAKRCIAHAPSAYITFLTCTLRDGVTEAVEIVVDWRFAGTERVLRTTNLSILLGDQRVSVRLTKGLNADWADLKRLLYTLRVH